MSDQDARQAPPRKWRRVLRWFVDGRSLQRFQAEREVHDHCLHSSVSGLERRGLRFIRTPEVVMGTFGAIHVIRYKLAEESVALARKLLGEHQPVHEAAGAVPRVAEGEVAHG